MRLFLSYQRSDSRHVAGRLRDRIVRELGPESIFLDVDSISIGRDVREAIRESIGAVDILIVLIGSNWDAQKLKRVDDYVHMEILEALRQKKPAVPVLLDDRSMPSPDSLPPDIQSIAYRNAARLRADPDFEVDCARLIRDLQDMTSPSPNPWTRATQGEEATASSNTKSRAIFVNISSTARSRLILIRVNGRDHTIDYRGTFAGIFTISLDGVVLYRDSTIFPSNFAFTIGDRGQYRARIEGGYKGIHKISKLRLFIDGEVIYSEGY